MPHIHFIGIGGAGIGPLAQVAYQAGFTVSGSDLKDTNYIDHLKDLGITLIEIGEHESALRKINQAKPVDWVVHTSALTINNPDAPVLKAAKELGIKTSKRDDFLNQLITEHNLKLIAVAGTHGKTTTTAMLVWLFKQLNINISYILPAKVSYGEMGQYSDQSQYFVYEADEYDHNFLSFKPVLSLITGLSWDHHEIFPSKEEYLEAFKQFISQSQQTVIWQNDNNLLNGVSQNQIVLSEQDETINSITLDGVYNRQDAYLSAKALNIITGLEVEEIIKHLNNFPGLGRRMEELIPNLYSDYAHTPERIKAAIDVAKEMTKESKQKIIIVYEPLTNRRQTYIKNDYKDCFNGASKVYWLDSYLALAREDPATKIITPEELIGGLSDPSLAEPAKKDNSLKTAIQNHLNSGDIVLAMAGGGGGSLDDWLRENFIDVNLS